MDCSSSSFHSHLIPPALYPPPRSSLRRCDDASTRSFVTIIFPFVCRTIVVFLLRRLYTVQSRLDRRMSTRSVPSNRSRLKINSSFSQGRLYAAVHCIISTYGTRPSLSRGLRSRFSQYHCRALLFRSHASIAVMSIYVSDPKHLSTPSPFLFHHRPVVAKIQIPPTRTVPSSTDDARSFFSASPLMIPHHLLDYFGDLHDDDCSFCQGYIVHTTLKEDYVQTCR